MNNGQTGFVMRKSVRKIKRAEISKNQNAKTQAVETTGPQQFNKSFRNKKDISRHSLSSFSSNQANIISAHTGIESHQMSKQDHNKIFINFCNRSTLIQQVLQKQKVPLNQFHKLAFMAISKFGWRIQNEEQAEQYIVEAIHRQLKKSKCEQNCVKRQINIDKLINDRIHRLEALIKIQ